MKIDTEVREVILVERDYKGEYERFALTPAEFQKEYPEVSEEITWPLIESDTATLRPLVHIWFAPAILGSESWETFFSDMEWGLPVCDIDSGNRAYIRPDLAGTLTQHLEKLADALK